MSKRTKSPVASHKPATAQAPTDAPVATVAPKAVQQPSPKSEPKRSAANLPPVAEGQPETGLSREDALTYIARSFTADRAQGAQDPATEAEDAGNSGTPPADEASDESLIDQSDQPAADADEAAEDHEEQPAADGASDGDQDAEQTDEDLHALSQLTDAELDAHGQSRAWPATYLRRVKKFTRQLREAQAQTETFSRVQQERDELRQRITQLETGNGDEDGQPQAEGIRAATPSERKITGQIETLRHALATIDEHLNSDDGRDGQPLTAANGQKWTVQQLRQIRESYREQIEDHRLDLRLFQREKAAARKSYEQQAVTLHPWLADRRNPDTVAVDSILREYPQLNEVPAIRVMLGDAVSWARQRKAAAAKGANGHANGTNGSANGANGNGHEVRNGTNGQAPKPANRVPARPVAAPLPRSRSQSQAAAVSQAIESGDRDAISSAVLGLVERRGR